MKPFLCLTVIVIFGCKHKPIPVQNTPPADTVLKVVETKAALPQYTKRKPNKYHTQKDTVYIVTKSDETMKYSRDEFNCIIDSFPELYTDNVVDPDSTYNRSKIFVDWVDSLGIEYQLSFGSEAGTDAYYMLYAWFLKNKNGIQQHAARRKTLLGICRSINALYGKINYGGTGFGHDYKRIEGYAEYDIYQYIHNKALHDKPKDISQQKAQFLSGLKQIIRDEVNKDVYLITTKDKTSRTHELNKEVIFLNKIITDHFYLEVARSFNDRYN
jgi:hypothetical protein